MTATKILLLILITWAFTYCTYQRSDVHKILDYCQDHGGLMELDGSIFTNELEGECSDRTLITLESL